MYTNWKKELEREFKENGDDFSKMVTTLTDKELLTEFYKGYGEIQGTPFTAWGKKFVYFPICCNGEEWVGSAPRNPCKIKLEHQGA